MAWDLCLILSSDWILSTKSSDWAVADGEGGRVFREGKKKYTQKMFMHEN